MPFRLRRGVRIPLCCVDMHRMACAAMQLVVYLAADHAESHPRSIDARVASRVRAVLEGILQPHEDLSK